MWFAIYLAEVACAVAILWKCADWFVEGAVTIADKAGVPHMFIGLVLVSLATTAPELTASLLAALRGNPEMALGNAIGSVIIDDTVALGLGAVLAPLPLYADPRLLKHSGLFLLAVCVVLLLLAFNGTLDRHEGMLLVGIFVIYMAFMIWNSQRKDGKASTAVSSELEDIENAAQDSLVRAIIFFAIGAAGVLLGSHLLLEGAIGIGELFHVPEYAMGLTIVAIGTSVPEIATVAMSAYKGKGGIGLGNIIGADILNICWVAGLSASVNPLHAEQRFLMISLICMLVVVSSMLVMLRTGHRLTRKEGLLLLILYLVYAGVIFQAMPRGT